MRYKREERTFLVNRWHKLENATLVKRAWRTKFKTKSAPKRKTILNLIEKFTKMSLVNDLPPKHKEISKKREIARALHENTQFIASKGLKLSWSIYYTNKKYI